MPSYIGAPGDELDPAAAARPRTGAAPDGDVAVVFGTRPEAVKLQGIVSLLGRRGRLLYSGQHHSTELFAELHADLGLRGPDETLAVGGQRRGEQIGHATVGLVRCFAARRPTVVVVQGDTNTALAGALAANAEGIPLVHVEAGLRSFDRAMPEEHNRVAIDHLADLCCAPTEVASANLAAEAVPPARIVVTGNTVVDAVARLLPDAEARTEVLSAFDVRPGEFVLATFHRPENVDDPDVLGTILDELAACGRPVVLPLHPRTRARVDATGLGGRLDGLRVTAPATYRTFLALSAECAVLVSDSGGIQEEASVLKRPVVVVRRSTERPEVLGTFATLVSPGPRVREACRDLLGELPAVHARLAALPSPYGTGDASARTLRAIAARIPGAADLTGAGTS